MCQCSSCFPKSPDPYQSDPSWRPETLQVRSIKISLQNIKITQRNYQKNQGTSRVPQVFMDVNSSRHTSRTIYHIVSCSYDCIGLDDTVSLLYDCIRMNLPVHSSLLSRIGNNNGSLYHRTVSDNSGILPWELGTSLYMITDIFFTHKRGKSIDPHQL